MLQKTEHKFTFFTVHGTTVGTASGLDLCRSLLEINPCTSVVYLTAYPDYSLDAWDTGACGVMVKPLTSESVRRKLKMLRFPFAMGGSDA